MKKVMFDEQVALSYDEDARSMFRPEVINPTVDFLVALAGDGAALEFAKEQVGAKLHVVHVLS